MTDPVLIDSIERLRDLIDQARVRGEPENNTATLAAADATTGRPSARTVYVHLDMDSFVFFVNARTGKGNQLTANPQGRTVFLLACACTAGDYRRGCNAGDQNPG